MAFGHHKIVRSKSALRLGFHQQPRARMERRVIVRQRRARRSGGGATRFPVLLLRRVQRRHRQRERPMLSGGHRSGQRG